MVFMSFCEDVSMIMGNEVDDRIMLWGDIYGVYIHASIQTTREHDFLNTFCLLKESIVC